MLRCLVAAGSNALRRAAMRPRGDGAHPNRTEPARWLIAMDYHMRLIYVRALSSASRAR